MIVRDGPTEPALMAYMMTAPTYHPVWSQYFLATIHLREVPGMDPPKKYRPDVTHEFHLYAVNPDRPVELVEARDLSTVEVLNPPNYAYQFPCENDATFLERMHGVVRGICEEGISPDTDFRSEWDLRFGDGVPLVRSAW